MDFENELLALSKRTGIPADKIKRDGDKFVIPTILKNEIWDKVDSKIKQNFESILRVNRQKDVCAMMKAGGLNRIGVREFLQSGEKIADLTYTRSDCGLE